MRGTKKRKSEWQQFDKRTTNLQNVQVKGVYNSINAQNGEDKKGSGKPECDAAGTKNEDLLLVPKHRLVGSFFISLMMSVLLTPQ
jgi:hypothetical protein